MKNSTILGLALLALTKKECYGHEELENRQLKSKKGGKSSKSDKGKILKSDKSKSSNSTKKDFSVAKPPTGWNQCKGKKLDIPNIDCTDPGVKGQSGSDVSVGYTGNLSEDAVPLTVPYFEAGLCPVNVHWHLGTEHRSDGQYDEDGVGPTEIDHRRQLAGKVRKGFQCKYYDDSIKMYTKHYDWKHCEDMEVGQTYEVHWPHSALGACGTINQYQTPFYDGVFCRPNLLKDTASQIGVQAQVFTIVNDESYYYPDLMRGMIVDGQVGRDITYYTGSTTGTTRNNKECSGYAPITWQVDRTCHLVSASTFDKMCADMKSQRDDMHDDLHPHGSRELVDDSITSDNHQ